MIKKIFLLALISITISSCSTYNGFSKRKYYDFSKGSEASGKIDKSDNKEEQVFSTNKQETTADNNVVLTSVVTEKAINTNPSNLKKHSIIADIRANAVSTKPLMIEKVSARNFVKVVKQKHQLKAQSEGRKGKLWWLWGIVGIVFIICSLFAFAYVFLICGILELALSVFELIKYKKSK